MLLTRRYKRRYLYCVAINMFDIYDSTRNEPIVEKLMARTSLGEKIVDGDIPNYEKSKATNSLENDIYL